MAQVSMAYFNYVPPVTVFMASQQEIETKASAHQHDGGLSENQGHLYLYCEVYTAGQCILGLITC